ncbi:hypothetical protein [Streptomyces incanus]|uniref:Uncharacterized protein n=1 Tax=Streptomyces incanus TaxID=887453 RepID=A0ABW0XUJ8_9ACTN
MEAALLGGLETLLRVFEEKASAVAVDGECLRGSRDGVSEAGLPQQRDHLEPRTPTPP